MFVCFFIFPFFFDRRLQQASSVDDQGKDKDASFRDDVAEVIIKLSEDKYKYISKLQCAKGVLYNSERLVDFSIGPVDFVHQLPNA